MGATIFALEHLGNKKPGFLGGAILGSCLLGSLIASLVVSLLTIDFLLGWSWRIAFLLGLSSIFKELKKQQQLVPAPFKTAILTHWRSCLFVFAIASFDGALTYTY